MERSKHISDGMSQLILNSASKPSSKWCAIFHVSWFGFAEQEGASSVDSPALLGIVQPGI